MNLKARIGLVFVWLFIAVIAALFTALLVKSIFWSLYWVAAGAFVYFGPHGAIAAMKILDKEKQEQGE